MSWPHRIFANQFTDFELKLLRVFRTVVDCGGFSPAEVELGLTKSAISKHVSDLEIRLGVRLCERGRSGFALTPEGEVVYDSTTQLLEALEEFRSRVNSFHSELVGTVYIGFIENLVTNENLLLHRILSDYVQSHPGLTLKLVIGSGSEIDRAVQERRLHIGVSMVADRSAKIISMPVLKETSYLYCGREHELFGVEDDAISNDLLSQCMLVQHSYSAAETILVSELDLKPRATSHQTEGILFLVLAGRHVGFLPSHMAKPWEATGTIRAIRPVEIRKETEIAIKAPRASMSNPIVRSFLAIARKHNKERADPPSSLAAIGGVSKGSSRGRLNQLRQLLRD
ncbi:LysR family transcriptional regulator [Mesorhizobium sp. 1M-11]|uniref:LysR family transcriptional regulator n=1 Tax=Mesorhizobium sp. 1M-11 TaxID=1529006 RepID=UPI0006C73B00|nr:LysR family transcriptional regulator [Mesorhizobium sp. 1M-11]